MSGLRVTLCVAKANTPQCRGAGHSSKSPADALTCALLRRDVLAGARLVHGATAVIRHVATQHTPPCLSRVGAALVTLHDCGVTCATDEAGPPLAAPRVWVSPQVMFNVGARAGDIVLLCPLDGSTTADPTHPTLQVARHVCVAPVRGACPYDRRAWESGLRRHFATPRVLTHGDVFGVVLTTPVRGLAAEGDNHTQGGRGAGAAGGTAAGSLDTVAAVTAAVAASTASARLALFRVDGMDVGAGAEGTAQAAHYGSRTWARVSFGKTTMVQVAPVNSLRPDTAGLVRFLCDSRPTPSGGHPAAHSGVVEVAQQLASLVGPCLLPGSGARARVVLYGPRGSGKCAAVAQVRCRAPQPDYIPPALPDTAPWRLSTTGGGDAGHGLVSA